MSQTASAPGDPPVEDRSDRRVVLSDPRAIRVLAHPARLTLLDELYAHREERTATELAELVGLSASATSYHLRALEREGLVARATPRADGRARPWRAAASGLSIESQHVAASSAAEALLLDQVLSRLQQDWIRWSGQASEPVEWKDAATLARTRVWLTADEAREAVTALEAALEPYRNRAVGQRPPDSREVHAFWSVVPVAPAHRDVGS